MPYEKTGKETRCIADEIPFEIPDSWVWVRLSSVILTEMGQSPAGESVSTSPSGVEFHQGKVFFGRKFLLPSNQTTTAPSKIVDPGTILLCVRAPVGKVNITQRMICIGRGLCGLTPIINYDREFLYFLLESYEDIFVKKATGTTFVAITANVVKHQLIPLPPFAEQKRIVAKIEELLPHLEDYDRAETRVTKLNAEFPEHLKKSILQWAIQGKLVPQDPNDEPASVLLERIRAEKAKLVKAGKLKKDKNESVIFRRDNSHYEKLNGVERCIDDEIPFEIPHPWIWVRLNSIYNFIDYRGKTPTKISTGIPLITAKNIKIGYISHIPAEFISEAEFSERKSRGISRKGDILFTTEAPLGNAALADIDNFSAGQRIITFQQYGNSNHLDNKLILSFILSPYFQVELKNNNTGTTVAGIKAARLKQLLLPLPPLAEQKRIVAEIERLFSLLRTMHRS